MLAADLTVAPPSRRMQGLLLVTSGSVLWSTTGLFVRMVDLDLWSIQVWRSLFAGASLLLLVVAEHGRATPRAVRAIGWPGLALVPVSAVSMVSYVAALQATSVANVLIIYATVPLLAAGIAFFWIGERAGQRTLIAAVAALGGIVVMAGGAGGGRDLLGNALAFVMTATFAVQVVTARRHPALSMAVVNALAALLCAAVAWPPMGAGVPDGRTLLVLALFGIVTTGASNLLFLLGARHIPSGEAGLLGLLDTVLSPLWVWLAFGETPTWAALLGGGIVLGSVIWYLGGGRRGAN
jgi:drug/metabolite transporter (DMT)-like permease